MAAETIQRLHPGKVVFTKRALDSTKDRKDSLAGTDWELLWAMATTLHNLVSCEECGDLEKRFKDLTGFDLAMTEGRHTKKDKKFMAMCREEFDGQIIHVTPHVKYGNNEPRLLRVHFFIDKSSVRLVVGHCAGHLETYGTQRR